MVHGNMNKIFYIEIIQTKFDELYARYEKDFSQTDNKKTEVTKESLLFPIPKNTQWEEIIVKFKNEFDVDVSAKGRTYSSDYEKMGFADRRIKKSKEKAKTHNDWTFLILLSTQEGIFPLDSLQMKEKKQKIKQKQSLSKKLTEAFPQIKDTDPDPFYEHNDIENNYKIKIKLIPIPTFRADYRDRDINYDSDDKLDIKDSYDELTDN